MSFFSPTTALMPLAIYLIYLGVLNLSCRPRVLLGVIDSLALSIGVSGLVIIGPLQILLPSAVMVRFGENIWYPMVLLYLFGATWLLLLSRPRIVIYGIRPYAFQMSLSSVLTRNQWSADQNENIVRIHELGIDLEIYVFPMMQNVILRPVQSQQSLRAWQKLRAEVTSELQTRSPCNYGLGFGFLMCGLVVAAIGCALI
ncbi:MAG: hypothetical protein P8K78_02505 [Pirellulales bacterium]|nr:hypothetical protein [Pirellulales bacterium]